METKNKIKLKGRPGMFSELPNLFTYIYKECEDFL